MSGGPLELLPDEWLDPSRAVTPVRAALGEIIEGFQEASVTLYPWLPAGHFPDIAEAGPPEGRPCWFVRALDEDMELMGDFCVDAETGELHKGERVEG